MLDIYSKLFNFWGLPVSLIRKNLIPYIDHVNKLEHKKRYNIVLLDLLDQTDQIRASLEMLTKLQNRPFKFKLLKSYYLRTFNKSAFWSHNFVFESFLHVYSMNRVYTHTGPQFHFPRNTRILRSGTFLSAGGHIDDIAEWKKLKWLTGGHHKSIFTYIFFSQIF